MGRNKIHSFIFFQFPIAFEKKKKKKLVPIENGKCLYCLLKGFIL